MIKGSDLTDHNESPLANFIKWREVSPLEIKLMIESRKCAGEKFDIDKENHCSICMCDLFDELDKITVEELVKNQMELINRKMSKVYGVSLDVVKLPLCEGVHPFHKECLVNQYKSVGKENYLKCSGCNKIYGVQMGNMPPGTMSWRTEPFPNFRLDGYSGLKSTIVIDYNIPSGFLPDRTRYNGTSRRAFLPGNDEGNKILALLIEAFKRKLTFAVGTSQTTGAHN